MHSLHSIGSRDRGFESHSEHGCLVIVFVCVCVCVSCAILAHGITILTPCLVVFGQVNIISYEKGSVHSITNKKIKRKTNRSKRVLGKSIMKNGANQIFMPFVSEVYVNSRNIPAWRSGGRYAERGPGRIFPAPQTKEIADIANIGLQVNDCHPFFVAF